MLLTAEMLQQRRSYGDGCQAVLAVADVHILDLLKLPESPQNQPSILCVAVFHVQGYQGMCYSGHIQPLLKQTLLYQPRLDKKHS